MRNPFAMLTLITALAVSALGAKCTGQQPVPSPHEPPGHALFTSPQSNPIALSPDGSRLYVVNTTSDSLSIIDTATKKVLKELKVGLEPVSVAVRPDGNRVWVANHLSDSISIVNTDPAFGPALLNEVIETVQDIDGNGSTDFDEPVGIAFESNTRAFVALSSRNRIAVVVQGIGGHNIGLAPIALTAQDPRAIAVRNGRLYVSAFESGNQSELSTCPTGTGAGEPPENCTLDENDLFAFATNPNLPGETKNIIIDTDVPDRDLYVYDAATLALVDVVEHVGTLLYGIAVSSDDRVFVAQTHARNAVNGIDGDNLIDLDNRIFLNQIAEVDCNGGSCGAPTIHELESLPEPECGTSCGAHPAAGDQLATPYGIAISDDDSTLVVTAAASSRVFSVNATTGEVRDILDVGAIPRGVALRSGAGDAPETAYVLNTLDNSVSVVDVSDPDNLAITDTIPVGNDPTPDAVRLGRIAFNDANASDTGTFACASCHPDGNTDQLLWRIGGACFFGACTGDDEPRSTMPIRGLKNTIPLHWDGVLGDPFGGGNGAVGGGGNGGTDCAITSGDPDSDHLCFLDLVDGALSGVMCDQTGTCNPGGNQLTPTERDNMATFQASVQYPPARARRVDDSVSASANLGFRDFFMNQGGITNNPDTCADSNAGCHELPLGAGTNSATLNGFDAPTMRGMTDRFLQFSMGVTAAEELQEFAAGTGLVPPSLQWNPSVGFREITTFAAAFLVFTPTYNVGPGDIFQMFEEASTGTSGATGRQVTLHSSLWIVQARADAALDLLDDLEAADARGAINLRGRAVVDGAAVTISYDADTGLYQAGQIQITRAELEAAAEAGTITATLTGRLPENWGKSTHTQPLLSVSGSGDTGDPGVPHLPNNGTSTTDMGITGTWVRSDSVILLDGQPEGASLECCSSIAGNGSCNVGGATFGPYCSTELIRINLDSLPSPEGTYLLQVQNPGGPQSNELPICVDSSGVNNCL